ncbi:hypothetical protein I6I49_01050 (plasmid) [Acinetobacter johnsonii]|nr:hypothetical protein [Acinetobacter johnsonii]QQV07924.1 hypothetical protein I6I49_01050 [Acinetobacter johnsonii]
MHEEDYGTMWKHYEFRTGVFEVRRSRRLVISFFCTVANYDYGSIGIYQDGTIQLEAKLTGIIQTSAITPGQTPNGGKVTPEIMANSPTLLSARLHMQVDGDHNSVTETEALPYLWMNIMFVAICLKQSAKHLKRIGSLPRSQWCNRTFLENH